MMSESKNQACESRQTIQSTVPSVSSFKIDQIDQIRPHIWFKKHTQNIKK